MRKVKRRIISITSMTTQITLPDGQGTAIRDNLASLCNDGTLWIAEVIDNKVSWTLFPDVPQPAVKPQSKPHLKGVPDGD